jgi:hypothetical protein
MEQINLEEYKSAWKTEKSFFEEKLSVDQITEIHAKDIQKHQWAF